MRRWQPSQWEFAAELLLPNKQRCSRLFLASPRQVSSRWARVQGKSQVFGHESKSSLLVVMSVRSSTACHPGCLEHNLTISKEFKACTILSSLIYLILLKAVSVHSELVELQMRRTFIDTLTPSLLRRFCLHIHLSAKCPLQNYFRAHESRWGFS